MPIMVNPVVDDSLSDEVMTYILIAAALSQFLSMFYGACIFRQPEEYIRQTLV